MHQTGAKRRAPTVSPMATTGQSRPANRLVNAGLNILQGPWLSATAQNFFSHPNWGSISSLIATDRGWVASARLVMLRTRIVF